MELEYETLSKEDYTVTYKTMSANNSEGLKDGDYITEPFTGYQVKTYQCKYSKDKKELISRDYIDRSDYRKRDGVICRIDSNTGGFGGGVVTDGDGQLPD